MSAYSIRLDRRQSLGRRESPTILPSLRRLTWLVGQPSASRNIPTSTARSIRFCDSYAYLHLPMVAGIVLLAFRVETMLHDVAEALDTVPAVALWGGTALYLLGHIAFLFRATHYVFRRRTIGAGALLVLIPAALALPALATLALVSAICSLVVAYEAIRHRAHRARIRHPDAEE